MKFSVLLAMGALQLLNCGVAQAGPGNEGGHGGDPYSIEFAMLTRSLKSELEHSSMTEAALYAKWNFSTAALDKAIHDTWVVSDEGSEVVLDGREVDAINSNASHAGLTHQILINRSRWRESDLTNRLKLVLHEYFGVMRIEQDRFEASVDFAPIVKATAAKILATGASRDLMANLFYSRVVVIPPLGETTTCDSSSAAYAQGYAQSLSQAQNKCVLSGKKGCLLFTETHESIMSPTVLGLRYCEILVIVR